MKQREDVLPNEIEILIRSFFVGVVLTIPVQFKGFQTPWNPSFN